jgi:hypothetical protein
MSPYVRKQSPLVLIRKTDWWEGESLISEEGKILGNGLCYEQKKRKLNEVFTAHDRNFIFNFGGGGGCILIMHRSGKIVLRLILCTKTEKNHGKT